MQIESNHVREHARQDAKARACCYGTGTPAYSALSLVSHTLPYLREAGEVFDVRDNGGMSEYRFSLATPRDVTELRNLVDELRVAIERAVAGYGKVSSPEDARRTPALIGERAGFGSGSG